jgi:hypothetical protein
VSSAARVSPLPSSLVQALRAEWTKARTTPGTAWLLARAVVLTIAVGPAPRWPDCLLTPGQGLGVVALWTPGTVLLGALCRKFRDA